MSIGNRSYTTPKELIDETQIPLLIHFPKPFDWIQKKRWRIYSIEWFIVLMFTAFPDTIKHQGFRLDYLFYFPLSAVFMAFIGKRMFMLMLVSLPNLIGAHWLADIFKALILTVGNVNYRLISRFSEEDVPILTPSEAAVQHIEKGKALSKVGKYEEAIQAYDKAIKLDPDDAVTWNDKGCALLDLSRHEEALQAFDEVIESNPQNTLAWFGKASVLDKLGKHEEALQACDKLVELDPQDASAWYGKGYVLNNLGRYEEALQACDKLIELDPQSDDAWFGKGYILNNLDRYEEALPFLDNATKIDPMSTISWYNKGVALDGLGRSTEAQACYDKARELGYIEEF